MIPESLNCPNCGAAVSTDSANCLFCQARLATVACPSCFGMMFIGSRHCQHCGAQAARIEENAGEVAKRNCPRCGIDLKRAIVGSVELRECERCVGLWVDVSSFEKICAEREQQSAVLGAASPVPAGLKDFDAGKRVRYVPCPVCNELMNRVNFARCSGVVIDVCKGHGTWFDRDEMQKIVEFIREGGLEASRSKEKQQISDEWQKLRREQLASSSGDSQILGSIGLNEDRPSVIGAAKGLLKLLVD